MGKMRQIDCNQAAIKSAGVSPNYLIAHITKFEPSLNGGLVCCGYEWVRGRFARSLGISPLIGALFLLIHEIIQHSVIFLEDANLHN